MHNEQALIAAFVKRSKRDRYREILSNTRPRHKFTNQLAHFTDFDPKYRLSIPSNKQFVNNIALELQKRHCRKIVFVISEDPALDQNSRSSGLSSRKKKERKTYLTHTGLLMEGGFRTAIEHVE